MAFYTILTDIGKAKLANATATGNTVALTDIAVGDGNGVAVTPDETALTLDNEVWRAHLNNISIDADNASWIIAEGYIPSTDGGFTVREVALFDDVGDMIAVGSYPDTYKPTLASGSAKDLYIKVIIEVSSASTVELVIDPAVVLVSREFLASEFDKHDSDKTSHAPLADLIEVKPGTIINYAGTTAPNGYLLCDGSELSQTTYADLFAVIENTWDTTGGAAAPTAGNFRLPPSEIGGLGLYMRGVGSTNGEVGAYQADVFKSHDHILGQATNSSIGGTNYWGYDGITAGSTTYSTGDATETRPRTITTLMCIKY